MFLFNLEIDSVYIIAMETSRSIFVPVMYEGQWHYDVDVKEYKYVTDVMNKNSHEIRRQKFSF